MRKKWMKIGALGAFLLALVQPAPAQESSAEQASGASIGMKSLPGYVEFDHSKVAGALKPNVSVLLEGAMLKMAAAASAEANTPITDLLSQLKLIQVKVFEEIESGQRMSLSQFALKKVAELKENGWTPAVSVPEEGERVDVLVKTSDDLIHGLVVLVVEEDEVVFVNLAGDINPEAIGTLIGKFGAGVFTGDFDFEDLLTGGGSRETESEEGEDDAEDEANASEAEETEESNP